MAQYATLKAAIDAVIKANGQREITGTVLNQTLNAMVNSLGADYQFAGVATPSTNPGTPDQNVFYLAGQGGTYSNFNNIVLPDGVSILMWNGSWSSQTVLAGDGGVFDISDYKATGGTLAKFTDLAAALDGGNNVPVDVRRGGMQVRFVQSSDNKYVQYRYMGTDTTGNPNPFLDTANWQFIDQLFYNFQAIRNQTEFDEIIDIDNRKNGVITFTPSAGVTFDELPNLDYSDGCILITVRKSQESSSNLDKQLFFCKNGTAYRVYYGGIWYPWGTVDYTFLKDHFKANGVTAVEINSLQSGVFSFVSTSVPTGLPPLDYHVGGLIITTRASEDTWTNQDRQFLITEDSVFERVYWNGWTQWYGGIVPKFKETSTTTINIDSLPTGINSCCYSSVPTGFPNLDYSKGGCVITVRQSETQLTNNDHQYVITQSGLYTRAYWQGSWTQWFGGEFKHERIIECGSGKQYTTLRAAMEAAIQEKGTKVIVYPGVYDLTQEYATELENHTGSGILLSNDVHVLFMPGAYVTCMVDVSNTWAYEHFEPFRVVWEGNSNFILENLNINCKNTRYCIHDEEGGRSIQYIHKYINCVMEQLDENPIAYYAQCIGGGLGTNGYIEVIGGRYKSTALYYITEHYTSPDDMQQPITYHNGNNATCDSKIIIKDVYLADKGYLRFGNYGQSTILTPVFVSGCRMYKPVFLMNETWDASQVQNFEIISYNNEIINP